MAGLTPTAGDARCLSFGHLVRLAVWQLRAGWRRNVPVESKLEWVKAPLQQIYPLDLLPRLANQTLSSLLDADPLASMRVKEKDTLYDTG